MYARAAKSCATNARRRVAGVRSVYSLPELVFVNERKGSFPNVSMNDAAALLDADD